MITEITNSKEEIKKLQLFISEIECQNIGIDNELANNPFLKYLVFVSEEGIVGYLSYMDIIDRYEIVNVFISFKNRKKGIGSKLLEYLIEKAKRDYIKNITLEVNEQNYPAIKLYTKYGFTPRAIRKGYYSGVDGILMEKEMI